MNYRFFGISFHSVSVVSDEESNRPLTAARKRVVAARWQHGDYAACSAILISIISHAERQAWRRTVEVVVRVSISSSRLFARVHARFAQRGIDRGKGSMRRVASALWRTIRIITEVQFSRFSSPLRASATDRPATMSGSYLTSRSGEGPRGRSRDDERPVLAPAPAPLGHAGHVIAAQWPWIVYHALAGRHGDVDAVNLGSTWCPRFPAHVGRSRGRETPRGGFGIR